jgi:alcohol dehydrogenase (cytochrome c)
MAILASKLIARAITFTAMGAAAHCAAAQLPLFRHGPAPEFTAEQVTRGQALYAQSCASCHGEQLLGAVGPALKGDSFRGDWNDEAPMTLMSYIHNQMPPSAAGSLSAASVANITAFLLQQNGYSAGGPLLGFIVAAGPREFNMGPRNEDAHYAAEIAARTERLGRITAVTDDMLLHPPDGDWLMWRRAYDALGHSPLRQIDKSNITRLRALWSWALPISPNEITPLAHDGVLFIKSADTVEALDAASGSLLWRYRRPLPDALQGGRGDIVKALAIYQDRLFVPTADGHLIALDVHSGHLLWDQPVLNPLAMAHHLRIDGGPLVVHGKVIVGASGCYTYHGGCFILAVDAGDGKAVWRFDTLARPGQPGGESWNGVPTEARYGGSVWTSGSYDPDSNLVAADLAGQGQSDEAPGHGRQDRHLRRDRQCHRALRILAGSRLAEPGGVD